MKALLCKSYGPPENLVLEELCEPVAGPGEVIIDVHAAGVNFPDLLLIQNLYQIKPELPFSPGCEVAGIVTETGQRVTGFSPGDRVVSFCLCGGFRERVAVSASTCLPVPDDVGLDVAAAIGIVFGTTMHALKDRAALRPGESLLVLGASGGVGLSAVILGKAMGARVIAAASSEEKLALCRQYGADEVVLYPGKLDTRESQRQFSGAIKDISGGEGVNVVYDPVGGDFAEPAFRATGWNGRYLVIGFAAGDIPALPLNLALLEERDILGVFWGAFAKRQPEHNRRNFDELFKMISDGRIRPCISARFALNEAVKALQLLAGRQARGKIIIDMKAPV